jgi:hypothetical protein
MNAIGQHARFKRAGVGTNGIFEYKTLSKNAHRTSLLFSSPSSSIHFNNISFILYVSIALLFKPGSHCLRPAKVVRFMVLPFLSDAVRIGRQPGTVFNLLTFKRQSILLFVRAVLRLLMIESALYINCGLEQCTLLFLIRRQLTFPGFSRSVLLCQQFLLSLQQRGLMIPFTFRLCLQCLDENESSVNR